MKSILFLPACLIALILTASVASSATTYLIDVGNGPVETGFTQMAVTTNTVTIDSVTFTLTGTAAIGSFDRGAGTPQTDLTRDGAQMNVDGARYSLAFGGAGDLQAGEWRVEVWSWDSFPSPTHEYGLITNGSDGAPLVTGAALDPVDPAATFTFTSNGTDAYGVFLGETSAFNRTRINALRLTLIPEPSSLLLSGLGSLLLLRRRR